MTLDEVDDPIRRHILAIDNVGPMVVQEYRLDARLDHGQPIGGVLTTLMRATLVGTLIAMRHNFHTFTQRAMEVHDIVGIGVLGKNDLLAHATHRRFAAISQHGVIIHRRNAHHAGHGQVVEVRLATRSDNGFIWPAHREVADGFAFEGLVGTTLDAVVDHFAQVRGDHRIVPGHAVVGNDLGARESVLGAQQGHFNQAGKRFFAIGGLVITCLFGHDDHVQPSHGIIGQHQVGTGALEQGQAGAILLISSSVGRGLEGHQKQILAQCTEAIDHLVRRAQHHIDDALAGLHALGFTIGMHITNHALEITQGRVPEHHARRWVGDDAIGQVGQVFIGLETALGIGHAGQGHIRGLAVGLAQGKQALGRGAVSRSTQAQVVAHMDDGATAHNTNGGARGGQRRRRQGGFEHFHELKDLLRHLAITQFIGLDRIDRGFQELAGLVPVKSEAEAPGAESGGSGVFGHFRLLDTLCLYSYHTDTMYPGQALEPIRCAWDRHCYTEYMARTRTPPTLTEAVYRKDWKQLDLLLAQGHDPNQENLRTRSDKQRISPLVVAVEQADLDLIKKLVKAGASPRGNAWSITPMRRAIMHGNLDAVKLLHELGVPLGSRKDDEPDYLDDALGMGHSHPHIIKWLIEQGLDPCKMTRKKKGWTLVNSCLSSNYHPPQNQETVTLLLDAGVDPRTPSRADERNMKQTHPISRVVGHGDAYLVKRFLQAGCDPNLVRDDYCNANGDYCPLVVTALMSKNVDSRVEVLEALVKGGARIDFKLNFNPHSIGAVATLPSLDDSGMPEERLDHMPLVALAACWSDPESVKYLLGQGQDLTATDRKGRNVLHGLVDRYQRNSLHDQGEMMETLEALLQAGVDPNHFNSKGNTPLHDFLMTGACKAQPNHPAYKVVVQFVNCMIQYGADPFLKNKKGKDAIALAVDNAELAGTLRSIAEKESLHRNTPTSKARPRKRF